ncbi:hypothetical protein IMCC12053_469 [Celeribacter marinus]|uniref:Uncharacterized protein n=1 Tax=Celeribacter marinus TaxID=1397108 RepID=A0A0P0A7T9_9RHOB|nr:hypothetical protein IMCC12053_469 [Celeribacter marinus]
MIYIRVLIAIVALGFLVATLDQFIFSTCTVLGEIAAALIF